MNPLRALRPSLPILIGASLMLSLAMGLRQSLGLFMPPLTRDIGISVGDFTLAVAVQNLAWGVLQPVAGAWAARLGMRRLMVGGALLYALGLALLASARGLLGVMLGAGVLIGAVDPDGEQMWWTGPGGLSSSRELSATHTVVFQFTDGEVEAPAQVSVREHYATRNIVAVLPAGFDERELVGVKLRDEDGVHPIAAASIRRLHHPDQLKSAP